MPNEFLFHLRTKRYAANNKTTNLQQNKEIFGKETKK